MTRIVSKSREKTFVEELGDIVDIDRVNTYDNETINKIILCFEKWENKNRVVRRVVNDETSFSEEVNKLYQHFENNKTLLPIYLKGKDKELRDDLRKCLGDIPSNNVYTLMGNPVGLGVSSALISLIINYFRFKNLKYEYLSGKLEKKKFEIIEEEYEEKKIKIKNKNLTRREFIEAMYGIIILMQTIRYGIIGAIAGNFSSCSRDISLQIAKINAENLDRIKEIYKKTKHINELEKEIYKIYENNPKPYQTFS